MFKVGYSIEWGVRNFFMIENFVNIILNLNPISSSFAGVHKYKELFKKLMIWSR